MYNQNYNNKIALLVCLDANTNHILYEYEFMHCINFWKKTYNLLNNIPIYVYIEKETQLHKYTHAFIKKHNIIVQTYNQTFKYKFLNTIYCQYLFEQTYSNLYDYSLYIDLDMYLIKSIPYTFFNKKTLFCIYDNNYIFLNKHHALNKRYIINLKNNIFTFNTYFIINYLKHQLFKIIYSYINNISYIQFFNNNKYDIYFYEECIYDFLYFKNIINYSNSLFIKTNNISYLNTKYFIHKHITTSRDILHIYDN